MIKTIHMLEINQPIGAFYIGKIHAEDLLKISEIKRREKNDGIQRELSETRTGAIAKYCEDPDATFPTPIILEVDSSEKIKLIKNNSLNDIFDLEYNDNFVFAEILDGQHRVEGIKKANNKNFELLVVIMFDLTEEEKAYVFSTINSNQAKVDRSLIYDLFELSEKRSPYKTCHELARILNSSPQSAFYGKLKMLGKKASDRESLSQGTFVTYLVQLISKNPSQDMIDIKNSKKLSDNGNYPLRKYFINNEDEIILKIIENYFLAVKTVFSEEWDNPDQYILSKTTGYGALIKVFKKYYEIGTSQKKLTIDFFIEHFKKVKQNLDGKNIKLTSDSFPSNAQTQTKLAEIFLEEV